MLLLLCDFTHNVTIYPTFIDATHLVQITGFDWHCSESAQSL